MSTKMRVNWSYTTDWFLWLSNKPFKVSSASADTVLNTVKSPVLVPDFWDFFMYFLNT